MSDHQRIDRLESQVSNLKRFSGGLLLLLLVAVFIGATRSQDPQDLRVKSLRVVDANGIDRILLRIDGNDDAGLAFKDGQNNILHALATRGDGTSMHMMRDAKGELRYILNAASENIMAWTMLSGQPGRMLQTLTNSQTGSVLSRYQVGEANEDAIYIGIDNEGRVLMKDLTKEEKAETEEKEKDK